MRDAPPTILLYAVLALGVPVVVIAANWDDVGGLVWVALALIAVLACGVVRGSRAAWWVAVVIEVLVIVTTPFDDDPVWSALIVAVGALACLLAPASRVHVGHGPVGREPHNRF